jgi:hypothetical protein
MKWFIYFLTFGLGFLMIIFPIIVFFFGDMNELVEVRRNIKGEYSVGIIIPLMGLFFLFAGYSFHKSLKK